MGTPKPCLSPPVLPLGSCLFLPPSFRPVPSKSHIPVPPSCPLLTCLPAPLINPQPYLLDKPKCCLARGRLQAFTQCNPSHPRMDLLLWPPAAPGGSWKEVAGAVRRPFPGTSHSMLLLLASLHSSGSLAYPIALSRNSLPASGTHTHRGWGGGHRGSQVLASST